MPRITNAWRIPCYQIQRKYVSAKYLLMNKIICIGCAAMPKIQRSTNGASTPQSVLAIGAAGSVTNNTNGAARILNGVS